MATDLNMAGIARNGVPGNFTYSAIGSPNRPIAWVNWGDAARFANWLTNGQPMGLQSLSTTEDGSYFLNGAMSLSELLAVSRKPASRFVIPTENEWYKAAYYDPTPGAGGNNYWLYPIRTDTAPFSDQPPGLDAPIPAIVANFWKDDGIANGYDDGYAVTGSSAYSTNVNYLTEWHIVAEGYGTFDQGGNVTEWNGAIATNNTGIRAAIGLMVRAL
jgi:formylglycine-generating enzyme required for sulfatase activity